MTNRNQKILSVLLLILCLGFIWGNSALPGRISGNLSNGILQWINSHAGTHLTGYAVRKLAHFSEFTLLGLILAWMGRLYSEKGTERLTLPLLGGVLAALTDETIQVFVPNRGPSVIDVWIDTSGVILGIGILVLGHAVVRTRRKHKYILEEQEL